MAKKKKATRAVSDAQPPLDEDWVEQLPEDLADAVDDYVRTMRTAHKAAAKKKAAKDRCIEFMKEHGITEVRIDEGQKVLYCEDKPNLQTRKVKKDELPESD